MTGTAASDSPDLIEVRGMVKRFGGELALAGVDFSLRKGEIHALLGQNGAGKSTLIKGLAGVVARDAGEIVVRGLSLPTRFTAADAAKAGLAFVHQDLGLCEELSVSENIALAVGYRKRARLISFRETERHVARLLAEVGIDVAPDAMVGQLSQDQKVMVAVARATALNAPAIVLDEISSSLPAPDVARLADSLRRSARNGVGYVYVTHRIDEVFDFADRLTVLRDGHHIATAAVADTTYEQVVEWIVGSAVRPTIAAQRASRASAGEEARLRVGGLMGRGLSQPVSFDVGPGEIVALCGLVGCGARAVAGLLGGADRPTSGGAILDGAPLPLGDASALRGVGCSYVPGDRQAQGGLAPMSIRENFFLPRLRGGRIAESVLRRPRAERRAAHALAERFEVRPSHDMDRSLTSLSGGNQQKVVCGRALRSHPRLLVVDDPTAGVDVGSRAQLHDILRDSAAAGTSIVIASTDYDEVAGLADRALVMVNGSVYAELARGDLAADRLAQASYGRGVAATDTTTA